MKKILLAITVIIIATGCNNNEKKGFTVNAKVNNTTAKTAYLEEVSIGTMQPIIVDSATVSKEGTFSLKANATEAAIYNVRLDEGAYPVASVINDKPSVDLNITLKKDNEQFAEKYEVKGSPASQSMKDFMMNFNNKLQNIFAKVKEIDSLSANGAPDSAIAAKHAAIEKLGLEVKEYTLNEIKKSTNAALTMFELGYYQSTANNPEFGIPGLENEYVTAVIDDLAKKNPNHIGIAGIKATLQKQMAQGAAAGGEGKWVGRQAPDFTLNDVNGQPVSLSSFKGKFVLVDFWASWCKPCRMENPTVVAAYNKFKDKNFTVLGVSLDEKKDAWLAAIKKDNLAWPQVSDLKYWESPVVPLYGIEGIPYNVLLDATGKVIAEGLRGPALEAKLTEVLK